MIVLLVLSKFYWLRTFHDIILCNWWTDELLLSWTLIKLKFALNYFYVIMLFSTLTSAVRNKSSFSDYICIISSPVFKSNLGIMLVIVTSVKIPASSNDEGKKYILFNLRFVSFYNRNIYFRAEKIKNCMYLNNLIHK